MADFRPFISPPTHWLPRILAGILLLLPLSCQSQHPVAPPDPQTARFEGIMLWKNHPVSRAALFLQPKDRPGGAIEFLTRSDGRFSYDLPPGTYLLHSAPTTLCPIRGTIHLHAGRNLYKIKVHSLSFLSCREGSLLKE